MLEVKGNAALAVPGAVVSASKWGGSLTGILLGTSRKSMIGLVLDLPPDQRLEGTAATVAIGIARGADIVRVHDVREMVRVCRMSDAIVRGRSG